MDVIKLNPKNHDKLLVLGYAVTLDEDEEKAMVYFAKATLYPTSCC